MARKRDSEGVNGEARAGLEGGGRPGEMPSPREFVLSGLLPELLLLHDVERPGELPNAAALALAVGLTSAAAAAAPVR